MPAQKRQRQAALPAPPRAVPASPRTPTGPPPGDFPALQDPSPASPSSVAASGSASACGSAAGPARRSSARLGRAMRGVSAGSSAMHGTSSASPSSGIGERVNLEQALESTLEGNLVLAPLGDAVAGPINQLGDASVGVDATSRAPKSPTSCEQHGEPDATSADAVPADGGDFDAVEPDDVSEQS